MGGILLNTRYEKFLSVYFRVFFQDKLTVPLDLLVTQLSHCSQPDSPSFFATSRLIQILIATVTVEYFQLWLELIRLETFNTLVVRHHFYFELIW